MAGILADVPSNDGKFRIAAARDFRFYVHVMMQNETVRGGKDEEEAMVHRGVARCSLSVTAWHGPARCNLTKDNLSRSS